MEEEKKLPKGLYNVVSQLITFIDDADYERKEKNLKSMECLLKSAKSGYKRIK